MPTRPLKTRALEKLQQVLTRGFREQTSGYGHFFWREGMAVWRNPYDLPAIKHGGLLLELGPKNRVVGMQCDDAGAAWDLDDEHHSNWGSLNTWALDVLKRTFPKDAAPLPAEELMNSLRQWNASHQSNRLLYRMVMDQWRSRPGMSSIMDTIFVPGLHDNDWLERARYLGEALVADKTCKGPGTLFEHHGDTLDSGHLTTWMLAMTFAHRATYPHAARTLAYEHARLRINKDAQGHMAYDWLIAIDPLRMTDLVIGSFVARVTFDGFAGIFASVRSSVWLSKMSNDERSACVRCIHDIVFQRAMAVSTDELFSWQCTKLGAAGTHQALEAVTNRQCITIMDTIEQEWWNDPASQGAAMLNTLDALYPWEEMLKNQPKQALVLVCQTALATQTHEVADINSALFEPSH